MLGVNETSACTSHIRWNERLKFQGQLKRLIVVITWLQVRLRINYTNKIFKC